MNYDLVFVTHIPVFYKVNLYNEINKNKNIFVIFVSNGTASKRSDDFLTLEKADFPYKVLSDVEFENRKKIKTLIKIQFILSKLKYKKIVFSGWDLIEFWYICFISPRSKNALALESTVYESSTTGIKGVVKKLFLSRVSKIYASGSLHKELLDRLYYKGEVVITKGVGIIRKPAVTLKRDSKINNRIIYLGRLSPEKNIDFLIRAINRLPWLNLDIYGTGPQEQDLKDIADHNISFNGTIPNSELENVFLKADFLILPSKSEPWGLVVEEAIFFGLPVLVSDRCGVVELLDCHEIFSLDCDLYLRILEIYKDIGSFQSSGLGTKLSLYEKDRDQVKVY